MSQTVKTVKAGDILPAREAMEMIDLVDLKSPIEIPAFPAGADPTNMSSERRMYLQSEIRRMKKEKNALLLAHNYEMPDIQDVADEVGDSLYLAQVGRDSKAHFLVEASVLFMNEILAIMKKSHQVVLAPHLGALCSLAAHADARKIRAWKREHIGGKVISYVNTYIDVKAESDYCCASANAAKVVQHVIKKYPNAPLLFLPDVYLGFYAAKMLEEMGESIDRLYLMMGACHVHDGIRPFHIAQLLEENPGAAAVIHPECGCTSACMTQMRTGKIAANMMEIRSTTGMGKFIRESPAKVIIMATEVENMYPLSKRAGGKTIIPASREARCAFMKQNTLQNVYEALRDEKHVITVDPELARRARVPIERMLAIV
ncbi:MAG: quinolinate synthase [Parcubacteria group bacterium Gr01-1014_91]|nr:MAG: quinolinate synthase [Parcubacteria group bacterium Gr01-1014_91]